MTTGMLTRIEAAAYRPHWVDMLDVNGAKLLLSQASRSGDYDGDGVVDANDYNVWKNSFV
jgi:hypothetical protein